MQSLKYRLHLGGSIAIVVMCLTAAVPPLSLRWMEHTRQQRDAVRQQMESLRRVESLLVDAETGQRGFVVTGNEEFLQPYRSALAALPREIIGLEGLYEQAPADERQAIAELVAHIRHKLDELAGTLTLRRSPGGLEAAMAAIATGTGKRHMDEVRRRVDRLAGREAEQLGRLDEELSTKVYRAMVFSVVTTVLTLAVLVLLGRAVWRSVKRREQVSRELQLAAAHREEGMKALHARNVEVSTMGEMSRILQTEMSLVESLEVTSLFSQRLLPGTHGAISLFRNSADLLEHAAGWGDGAAAAQRSMLPTECWGLRRGQMHKCCSPRDLKCHHYADQAGPGWHLCQPLMAYGEVLGQLHVWCNTDNAAEHFEECSAMAQTISEQVALSLSNAKLRQVLRDQSIKDALTGLFNRRYMEETLTRELARAQRNGEALAVILADLDHFKQVNDTHGHPAGDVVLKVTAQHLKRSLRASDVACRFGGEEFVMILPACSKEDAIAKAQELCERMAQLSFRDSAAGLQLTASFGVAAFPGDATTLESLLEEADGALYRAKNTGRNRVVAANESTGFTPALVSTGPG